MEIPQGNVERAQTHITVGYPKVTTTETRSNDRTICNETGNSTAKWGMSGAGSSKNLLEFL